MPEPMEPAIKLPKGGCWPRALVRIELDGVMSLDDAVFELAGASRRLRQGVSALYRGRPVHAFPHESVDDVVRRWVSNFRMETSATAGELPPRGPAVRWTASRKVALTAAIREGDIGFSEALMDYHLSADELVAWLFDHERHGHEGLKSTKLQALWQRRVG